MANVVPSLLARDERFGALAKLTERLLGLDTSKLLVYLVDLVDEQALPHLADQFHVMGLEGWSAALSDESRRALIKSSIELHRHKGTPWAMKQALAPLGLSVDVIDQAMQRAAYAAQGALKLDGSWKINGAKKIRPTELFASLPQIQHWAEFIVRVNLADVTRAESFALLRPLVDEWKPARSWPIFLFWLAFVLEIGIALDSMATLKKQSGLRYPWGGRVISDAQDTRWTLGRDGDLVKLPQPFGTFRLGERRGGFSIWRLKTERITSALVMTGTATAAVYRLPKLGEPSRRLDGSWRIGGRGLDTQSDTCIQSLAELIVPSAMEITFHDSIRLDYPGTPAKLGSYARLAPGRRLDGSWALGKTTRPSPFGFVLRREGGVLTESASTVGSSADVWCMPERLARPTATKLGESPRRLDGSWTLGADARFGQFRLDGRTKLRARKLTTCPQFGRFSLAPDLPGVDTYERAPSRRLRLDGSWRIGGPATPLSNLTIIKEHSHG